MSVTRDVVGINPLILKITYEDQEKLQSLRFTLVSMVKLCDHPTDV